MRRLVQRLFLYGSKLREVCHEMVYIMQNATRSRDGCCKLAGEAAPGVVDDEGSGGASRSGRGGGEGWWVDRARGSLPPGTMRACSARWRGTRGASGVGRVGVGERGRVCGVGE